MPDSSALVLGIEMDLNFDDLPVLGEEREDLVPAGLDPRGGAGVDCLVEGARPPLNCTTLKGGSNCHLNHA